MQPWRYSSDYDAYDVSQRLEARASGMAAEDIELADKQILAFSWVVLLISMWFLKTWNPNAGWCNRGVTAAE
jgi:hypothetical protein